MPPENLSSYDLTEMRRSDVANALGIDDGYWRRLTLGDRCPSRALAQRLIEVLDLDEVEACALLEAAV